MGKNSNINNEITRKISTNLTLLLKHYSLSFRKVAKAIGVSHPLVFNLVKGKRSNPSITAVNKMSRLFKISMAQLLGEQEIDFESLPKKSELDFDEE